MAALDPVALNGCDHVGQRAAVTLLDLVSFNRGDHVRERPAEAFSDLHSWPARSPAAHLLLCGAASA